LLIAAAAELAGLTVLHLDKDFDLIVSIATITGHALPRPWSTDSREPGHGQELTLCSRRQEMFKGLQGFRHVRPPDADAEAVGRHVGDSRVLLGESLQSL